MIEGPTKKLLVVDDSADTRELLERNLTSHGFHVFTASDVTTARTMLETRHFDIVITDLKMPGESGMELLKYIRQNLELTESIVITGFPSVEGAVSAMKLGAEDYLTKPFTREELKAAVDNALDKLYRRQKQQKGVFTPQANPFGLIGDSQIMQDLFQDMERLSSTTESVLLTGENGTGRRTLARAIHSIGSQAEMLFITVACSLEQPEVLGGLLSRLATRDSFTDQVSLTSLSRFASHHVTIFLEDVNHLPLSIQDKIFKILYQESIEQTRGHLNRPVRIMASSDCSRDMMKKQGHLRQDLLRHLAENNISVPPLRERESDSVLMMNHFMQQYSMKYADGQQFFSDDALVVLKSYPWPGNIGELRNVALQLVQTSGAEMIEVSDLPLHLRLWSNKLSRHEMTLVELEKEHIRIVLDSVHGNKTKAAEILGINRKTLREKLKSPLQLHTKKRKNNKS